MGHHIIHMIEVLKSTQSLKPKISFDVFYLDVSPPPVLSISPSASRVLSSQDTGLESSGSPGALAPVFHRRTPGASMP